MAPEAVSNPDMLIFGESEDMNLNKQLDDYLWTYNEQPHAGRRRAILKAHPEVRKLMGYDPITAVWVLSYVGLQMLCAFLLRDMTFSWQFFLVAYVVGATCNHALFLSIHEIGHNLAFHSMLNNRILSLIANLPVGLPYAIAFRGYHNEHHKLQGVDGYDTDLPTAVEGIIFNNVLTKTIFCTTQILFYALRPMVVRYQKPTFALGLNWLFQLSFDALVIWAFGWGPICYFLASDFFAGSLHPVAGHFISEHYVFANTEHETFSYYGPLNFFSFNVGYHNEHHDFPNIPWTRLPDLRRIAPEYYDTLPYHTSWFMVTWRFITDRNISVLNRVKRRATTRDLATASLIAVSDYVASKDGPVIDPAVADVLFKKQGDAPTSHVDLHPADLKKTK